MGKLSGKPTTRFILGAPWFDARIVIQGKLFLRILQMLIFCETEK